jgi:hypothetical protein
VERVIRVSTGDNIAKLLGVAISLHFVDYHLRNFWSFSLLALMLSFDVKFKVTFSFKRFLTSLALVFLIWCSGCCLAFLPHGEVLLLVNGFHLEREKGTFGVNRDVETIEHFQKVMLSLLLYLWRMTHRAVVPLRCFWRRPRNWSLHGLVLRLSLCFNYSGPTILCN